MQNPFEHIMAPRTTEHPLVTEARDKVKRLERFEAEVLARGERLSTNHHAEMHDARARVAAAEKHNA